MNFLNKTNGQTLDKKSTASYIKIWRGVQNMVPLHTSLMNIKPLYYGIYIFYIVGGKHSTCSEPCHPKNLDPWIICWRLGG